MNKYEVLLELAASLGIIVIIVETEIRGLKGLYYDGVIALSPSLTEGEKATILAEEIGHYLTAVGNILDLSNIVNRKLELRGKHWAYNYLAPVDKIKKAIEGGCLNTYELAEELSLPEPFVVEAITYYRNGGLL